MGSFPFYFDGGGLFRVCMFTELTEFENVNKQYFIHMPTVKQTYYRLRCILYALIERKNKDFILMVRGCLDFRVYMFTELTEFENINKQYECG